MTGKTPLSRTVAVGRRAAVGLIVVLVGGFGLAQEVAKAPEPLEAELVGIRGMMMNASANLKNGIVGVRTNVSNAPDTPAGRCCAKNLQVIQRRIGAADRILEAFDRCYVSAGQDDLVLAGRVARSDLVAFSKTLAAFAKAPNEGQARGALQAMTRTYNLLRETAVSLEPCEGMESLTSPDETGERPEDSGQSKQPSKD